MLNIKVILGSTREGRFGEKVFNWVKDQFKEIDHLQVEFLDLKDLALPFFNESVSPKQGISQNPLVTDWDQKIAEADGFIVITPEYNHGYPAVLKNAIDYLYFSWNNKPIAFVSYGAVGGARAVEQLRQVAIELQMAPIRESIQITKFWELFDDKGQMKKDLASQYEAEFSEMLKQLVWWADALNFARLKSQDKKKTESNEIFVAVA